MYLLIPSDRVLTKILGSTIHHDVNPNCNRLVLLFLDYWYSTSCRLSFGTQVIWLFGQIVFFSKGQFFLGKNKRISGS